jgi:hypothetical protein
MIIMTIFFFIITIMIHACMLLQNKLTQQDHMTKQLRKAQKDLKENSGALTNQKTNFLVTYLSAFYLLIYISIYLSA